MGLNVDKHVKNHTYFCAIPILPLHIETDLAAIADFANDHLEENDRFRLFLKQQDGRVVDELVCALNDEVTTGIDCTACGNCCKSLMIVVTDEEADTMAAHLGHKRGYFDEKYIEKGGNGMMLINQMPCHFLTGNKCTVYEHRFAGCREFPALHVPGITKRLFTLFMHYDRCPIIFNVLEQLKDKLEFTRTLCEISASSVPLR